MKDISSRTPVWSYYDMLEKKEFGVIPKGCVMEIGAYLGHPSEIEL